MTRGQSEYIGAVILITITVSAVALLTQWYTHIVKSSEEVLHRIDRAKEYLHLRLLGNSVIALNRGSRTSAIDLVYLQLENSTIVLEKTSVKLRPGEEISLPINITENTKRVCVETRDKNVFCSNRAVENRSNLYLETRLYPLLAKYLSPQDYYIVTRSYYPVDVAVFRIDNKYLPAPNLLYVEVRWDTDNWYITYRKKDSEGFVLDVITLPRSLTYVPPKEYLYNSSCTLQNNVRYCFNVYVIAEGYCSERCNDPENSRWYFVVGMKIDYRFESTDPGYRILAIVNKTTFDAALGRGAVTCYSYTSRFGYSCITCSHTTTSGSTRCEVDVQTFLRMVGGPRPVFMWEISYPQYLEDLYWDDGLALGAFYPYTSIDPPLVRWNQSEFYRYTATPSSTISIKFYIGGVYDKDYLAKTYDYIYNSYKLYSAYRLWFDLITDEGGVLYDYRVWDYSIVVFLMKKLD